MSGASICTRTNNGLKLIENHGDIPLFKCEILASCDGSLEIKIPEEIKDKLVIESLRKCNETREAASDGLMNRAKAFSGGDRGLSILLHRGLVIRTGLTIDSSGGGCWCPRPDPSESLEQPESEWLRLEPLLSFQSALEYSSGSE